MGVLLSVNDKPPQGGLNLKRERGALRSAASYAKKRLATGFWENERTRRDQVIESTKSSGIKSERVLHLYINQLRDTIQNDPHDQIDDEIYNRVSILLSRGISSPLAHMLDHERMSSLPERDRERYVFNLSKQVQEATTRYYNHQLLSHVN